MSKRRVVVTGMGMLSPVAPIQGLYSYNVLEVSELKNKMSDDMRILFTEYRQKRKGKFDSNTRRADDILNNEIN